MSDPIRIECPACGQVFTEDVRRPDCPHEHTTSFTKTMARAIRRMIADDVQ